jgi:hypothetical protein
MRLAVVMAVFAGGTVALTAGGRLDVPFEHVVTLRGRLASVGDLFRDPRVVRILREHDLRVETTSAGSREVATGDLTPWDFVFPSGEPAAKQIHDTRQAQGAYSAEPQPQPFQSPLVLATYRPYAEALVHAGAAVRTGPGSGPGTGTGSGPGSGPGLYYSLDMHAFLRLTEGGKKWSDIGLRTSTYGFTSRNVVLAHTSDTCESNSADSYLALVAYTLAGGEMPTGPGEADALARRAASVLRAQGGPGSDLFSAYVTDEGRRTAPVAVVYEHQYLDYQARYRATHPSVDTDRVLLYPREQVMSRPHFIALDPAADRLGRLLVTDPALRRREAELGYRVTGGGDSGGAEFADALAREGVPVPHADDGHDLSQAILPDEADLDRMVAAVKPCPPPVRR